VRMHRPCPFDSGLTEPFGFGEAPSLTDSASHSPAWLARRLRPTKSGSNKISAACLLVEGRAQDKQLKCCPTQRAATSAQTRQKRGPIYMKISVQCTLNERPNTSKAGSKSPKNQRPMYSKRAPRTKAKQCPIYAKHASRRSSSLIWSSSLSDPYASEASSPFSNE
jgi:hypothetical protein